jgi:acyl transferase domain-containing protein
MLAVGLSFEKAEQSIKRFLKDDDSSCLVVACNNSPTSVTISGDTDAVESLSTVLKREVVYCRKLRVRVAYHSPHMRNISALYHDWLGNLQKPTNAALKTPEMISSVDNYVMTAEQACNPYYWTRNLELPVRFYEALGKILKSRAINISTFNDVHTEAHPKDFVEIGPHCALMGPCWEILSQHEKSRVHRYDSVLTRKQNPLSSLLRMVGNLFTLNYAVDIMAANSLTYKCKDGLKLLDKLPQYPFDRSKVQQEKRISDELAAPLRKAPRLDLLGLLLNHHGPP